MAMQVGVQVKAGSRPAMSHAPVGLLQGQCARCDSLEPDGEERLQAQGLIQRMAADARPEGFVPPIVHQVLATPGQPLDPGVRAFMEPRFGHDFSRVRVHTDAQAAQSAGAMHALAYTVGSHIVFDIGQYSPSTSDGRGLLAHELAHSLQQNGGNITAPPPMLAVGRAEGAYEREADNVSKNVMGDSWQSTDGQARVGPRMHISNTSSKLQRKLKVIDPSKPAAYLPAPDNTRQRAELVEEWLQKLCPSGNWQVDRGKGDVIATNGASICGGKIGGASAKASTPVSCDCLCRAVDPATDSIEIMIQERLNYDYFTFDPKLGIYTLTADVAETQKSGEGLTLFPEKGAWLSSKTVVLSGRSTTLAGAGDTSQPGKQKVSDPPWLILAHEICGHIGVRAARGADEEHVETPTGDRSAVDVENRIRREHSTTGSSLGIRSGDTGGIRGGIYTIGAGETFETVSLRLGMSTGASAFDANGEHKRILHWPSGDRITRADTKSLFTAGAEIFVEGIHWHEVIANETWASIAATWRIPVASLQRANPGITPTPGTRLLIPVQ